MIIPWLWPFCSHERSPVECKPFHNAHCLSLRNPQPVEEETSSGSNCDSETKVSGVQFMWCDAMQIMQLNPCFMGPLKGSVNQRRLTYNHMSMMQIYFCINCRSIRYFHFNVNYKQIDVLMTSWLTPLAVMGYAEISVCTVSKHTNKALKHLSTETWLLKQALKSLLFTRYERCHKPC
jgi:hypothetical protein